MSHSGRGLSEMLLFNRSYITSY